MRVGLYTLGCKVSQYETSAISEEFLRRGWETVPFEDVADAYVINTCTVTAESDRKSRQVIRRAIGKNPDAIVAVIGCYSQRDPKAVSEIDGVDIVIGTDNKMSVVDMVIERLSCREKVVSVTDLDNSRFEPMCVTSAPRTRAYVKIEDGCECRCSYCAIADARGPVRSKPMDEVIKEVEGLFERGTLEIVLTGIEIGSYGRDLTPALDLADLILALDRRGSARRIRLGSLAPELVGSSFADRVKDAGILVPHFHISMQSGSNNVLARMRRRYTREKALENIKRLRTYFPSVQFTADLMVGFPGETEEDFELTVDFVREAGLLDSHVFAYSRRKDTPAATFGAQVEESVKRERSQRLRKIQKEETDRILSGIVERREILYSILESEEDGEYRGHSDSYVEVSAVGEPGLEGTLALVLPVSHKDGVIHGKIVEICK